MLAKRIIPCLDVRAGKVTKGIRFLENVDVGDPVAMARYYYEQGADELVFYDITASNESQCIVLSMQVKHTGSRDPVPSGYEVVIDGGRVFTGRDAVEWAREGERRGAGELVINSIDRDGTKSGYDLEITRKISEAVSIPVVASGGAGAPEHLRDAFTRGAADAAIVASIVHYGEFPIPELKRYLRGAGVEVRDTLAPEAAAR